MIIDTPNAWWRAVDSNWSDLLKLIVRFNSDIVVHSAKDIGLDAPSIVDLEEAKTDRDEGVVLHYLRATWNRAPDEPWIHKLPKWGLLCDLLSEDWVFSKEGEKDYS
jgi:hypothetical protein